MANGCEGICTNLMVPFHLSIISFNKFNRITDLTSTDKKEIVHRILNFMLALLFFIPTLPLALTGYLLRKLVVKITKRNQRSLWNGGGSCSQCQRVQDAHANARALPPIRLPLARPRPSLALLPQQPQQPQLQQPQPQPHQPIAPVINPNPGIIAGEPITLAKQQYTYSDWNPLFTKIISSKTAYKFDFSTLLTTESQPEQIFKTLLDDSIAIPPNLNNFPRGFICGVTTRSNIGGAILAKHMDILKKNNVTTIFMDGIYYYDHQSTLDALHAGSSYSPTSYNQLRSLLSGSSGGDDKVFEAARAAGIRIVGLSSSTYNRAEGLYDGYKIMEYELQKLKPGEKWVSFVTCRDACRQVREPTVPGYAELMGCPAFQIVGDSLSHYQNVLFNNPEDHNFLSPLHISLEYIR